jgi:two-component system chemotaxis response regulator CheB
MGVTRILLVEDSDIFAEIFAANVAAACGVEIIGRAKDGVEGVAMASKLEPDVILMDVQMPRKNGIDAAREIRALSEVPILVLSAVEKRQETAMCYDAIGAGATAFVAKPSGEQQFRRLVTRLKLVASASPARQKRSVPAEAVAVEVAPLKLVASASPARQKRSAPVEAVAVEVAPLLDSPKNEIHVVAIASSTGGPAALAQLLRALPETFPVPIVIVQHMSDGFQQELVEWLNSTTRLEVCLASAGVSPRAGHVYIANHGAHLVFDRRRTLRLDSHTPPREGYSPSGSVLFHSMVRPYGAECLGLVLTGMGDDGSDGLLALRSAGATTMAQDSASSTIDGMPKSARGIGAAMHVRPLDQLAAALCSLTEASKGASIQRFSKLGA